MRQLLLIAFLGLVIIAAGVPISFNNDEPINLLDVADAGNLHSNDAERLVRHYSGWGGGWSNSGGWGDRWRGGGWGGWGGWRGRGWGGWGGSGWGGWRGRGWGGAGYWR